MRTCQGSQGKPKGKVAVAAPPDSRAPSPATIAATPQRPVSGIAAKRTTLGNRAASSETAADPRASATASPAMNRAVSILMAWRRRRAPPRPSA
jgi:hypothetical protein